MMEKMKWLVSDERPVSERLLALAVVGLVGFAAGMLLSPRRTSCIGSYNGCDNVVGGDGK